MTVLESRFDKAQRRGTIKLIRQAKEGDRDAQAAVHAALMWLMQEREPIPGPLRRYLAFRAADDRPSKRGQPAHRRHLRDDRIAFAVKAVMDYEFDHRRNPATKTPSACSIVAEVLAELGEHMTEKNVEKISRPRAT